MKAALRAYGIDGFVAHDDIEPSEEWQNAIEVALGTCHALAAFLHDGFRGSAWTDQEVGYGIARRVPILPLMFKLAPHGFMGRWQAARCHGRNPKQVAARIFEMLITDERTRGRAEDAIITSVIHAANFDAGNARTERLSRITDWTPTRLQRLRSALNNSQISGAWQGKPRVDAILRQHDPHAPTVPPGLGDVPF